QGIPGAAGGFRDLRISKCQCHRSEEHTSELQSLAYLVCRLLLEKKKKRQKNSHHIIITALCYENGDSAQRAIHSHDVAARVLTVTVVVVYLYCFFFFFK